MNGDFGSYMDLSDLAPLSFQTHGFFSIDKQEHEDTCVDTSDVGKCPRLLK